MAYNLAGQYEKAAEMFKRAIQKNPQIYLGHMGYSVSTGLLGRNGASRHSVKELLQSTLSFQLWSSRTFSPALG